MTINPDRLVPALKKLLELLKQIPRSVTFPNGLPAAPRATKPTQLELIHTGLSNLVDAYKGLTTMVNESTQAHAALAETLKKSEERALEAEKAKEN